jgi:nicotinate-nucleotide pyrophosphorylase (carboxylating)
MSTGFRPQSFEGLLPPHFKRDIEEWIKDDCPSIDIGGLVVGDKIEEAILYGKSKGVLAGKPFFNGTYNS